jgi:hypothetical protein
VSGEISRRTSFSAAGHGRDLELVFIHSWCQAFFLALKPGNFTLLKSIVIQLVTNLINYFFLMDLFSISFNGRLICRFSCLLLTGWREHEFIIETRFPLSRFLYLSA